MPKYELRNGNETDNPTNKRGESLIANVELGQAAKEQAVEYLRAINALTAEITTQAESTAYKGKVDWGDVGDLGGIYEWLLVAAGVEELPG